MKTEESFKILKRWRVGAIDRLMARSHPGYNDTELQADILLMLGLLETIYTLGNITFELKQIVDQ